MLQRLRQGLQGRARFTAATFVSCPPPVPEQLLCRIQSVDEAGDDEVHVAAVAHSQLDPSRPGGSSMVASSPGRMSAQQLTLLLSHEISNVITAMRFNAKWSVVNSYYEEDRNEPNKYDDAFRTLRGQIYTHQDWLQVDPLTYLTPFLSLLKASDVSGPITGTVAVALQRILASDLIVPETFNAGPAINQLVEDTTQGKFESTSNAQDEEVLLNIVQVLALAIECKASVLLTDETYCKAFQSAFMLGDPVTKPKEYGEISWYYSRQVCGVMVRTLFKRLRLMVGQPDGPDAPPHAADGAGAQNAWAPASAGASNHAHGHSHFLSQPTSQPHMLPVESPAGGLGGSGGGAGAWHYGDAATAMDAHHGSVVPCMHGAKAAMEILDFLIQLIKKKEQDKDNQPVSLEQVQVQEESVVFALQMVHTALLAAGPALAYYEDLVAQVHVELLHAMCEAVVSFPHLSVITGTCQILSILYSCLGSRSIGQLELVLSRVVLKLAEGKGVRELDQQEVALEGLLDLIRTPGFVHDIFVNCDCRLERNNLFEQLVGLLSRTAHSAVKGALGPLQLVSLDALTVILSTISSESKVANLPPPPPDLELDGFVDIWTPMAAGQHPDLMPLMQSETPGVSASQAGEDPSVMQLLRSAVYEKHLKHKVALAIDHFNKDHKKGLQHLQALRLLPMLEGSPAAQAALAAATPDKQGPVQRSIVNEDELAVVLGNFLHSCPGLNKVAIGELLGEPDKFYLKVLDSYTASFDFSNLKFDAGIRMFLESFKLPGEAQKIDRIIHSFGKHFFTCNQGIFKNSDAAYVMAYSVIMLNTDQHNPQVKKKMDLQGFRRNLRGVNGGEDFPADFLDEIFYSIVRNELRMTEAVSLDVSEQRLVELHQLSRTPRGHMLDAHEGRHMFDARMFQLLWNPTVSAMCAIIDNVKSEAVVESALSGLLMATTLAAQHQLDDVADTVMTNLARIPMQLTHITPAAVNSSSGQSQRPDVVFGHDGRMKAVTLTIATIANRHGDSLTTGWVQLVELLVVLYRQGVLPDSFTRALDGDGEGGLAVREGEATGLRQRRMAAARAASNTSSSFFKAFSSMLVGGGSQPDDGYGTAGPPLNESDKAAVAAGEALLARCAFEDIFLDAKFLKQESLVYLVKAVITASGPIPRPTTVHAGVTGSLAYAAGGAPINGGWDVSELTLELMFGILLRNRDRIAALWPPVYDHLQDIFSHSKDVEPVLVQKAVMAVMRLCMRLLPYKPHISHQLVKGVQLVSLVDGLVAADMATTIATELYSLLKGAAKYLQTQQVWATLTGLLKIIQYDIASFPACVAALSSVIRDGLTVVNFPCVLSSLIDLLERAAEFSTRGQSLQVSAHTTSLLAAANASRSDSANNLSTATNGTTTASTDASTDAQAPTTGGGAAAATTAAGGGTAGGTAGQSDQGSSSQPSTPPQGLLGDPIISELLNLLRKTEEWLEVWWVATGSSSTPGALPASRTTSSTTTTGAAAAAAGAAGVPEPGPPDMSAAAMASFHQDAWSHVITCLCRAIRNSNLQIRLGAQDVLQRSVVAAEKLQVPATVVQRVLLQQLLPITSDMARHVATVGATSREFPQADVTVRELVRALAKVVLLYAPVMGNIPSTTTTTATASAPGGTGPADTTTAAAGGGGDGSLVVGSTWGPAWRSTLDFMVQSMAQAAPKSELLAETIPEALKNMVLMLHAKGALREGWRDAHDGADLADATWRAARKVSANLTPAILQLH